MAERPEGWDHKREDVQGKKILITGGTTGIGRATARLLAMQGAEIMLYGHDTDKLEEALTDVQAVARGKVHGITADQADREEVARVFQEVDNRLGGLDILINNAAGAAEDVESMDDATIERVVKINLLGYLLCAKHAMERMKKRGGGHIVNVGSLSSEVREKSSGVYVATKAGIQAWTESFRNTFNKEGIHVSLLELGSVGTDMQGSAIVQRVQEMREKMMTAEDVAEAVLFCLVQPSRCDIINIRMRPHRQLI